MLIDFSSVNARFDLLYQFYDLNVTLHITMYVNLCIVFISNGYNPIICDIRLNSTDLPSIINYPDNNSASQHLQYLPLDRGLTIVLNSS